MRAQSCAASTPEALSRSSNDRSGAEFATACWTPAFMNSTGSKTDFLVLPPVWLLFPPPALPGHQGPCTLSLSSALPAVTPPSTPTPLEPPGVRSSATHLPQSFPNWPPSHQVPASSHCDREHATQCVTCSAPEIPLQSLSLQALPCHLHTFQPQGRCSLDTTRAPFILSPHSGLTSLHTQPFTCRGAGSPCCFP